MRIQTIASAAAEILATIEPPREPRTAEEADKYLMHAVNLAGGKSSWQVGDHGFFRAYFDLHTAGCFLMATHDGRDNIELDLVATEDNDPSDRFSIGLLPIRSLPAQLTSVLKKAKTLTAMRLEIESKITQFNRAVSEIGGTDRLNLRVGE